MRMANTKNNARSQASRARIIHEFICLLEEKDLDKITVTEICARAGINRATFYSHFADVYALADSIKEGLEAQTKDLYEGMGSAWGVNNGNYTEMLEHVREHQMLYMTYFKLVRNGDVLPIMVEQDSTPTGDESELSKYHRMYRRAGISTVVKMWLMGGCKESIEEVAEVLSSEVCM